MKPIIPRSNKRSHAPVIEIDRYRQPTSTTPAKRHIARRTTLIQETVDAHLRNPDAQPVALAMVVLRTDGKLASVAEALEPEQASIFADELEALAARLRVRAGASFCKSKQRGFNSLATIIPLVFMAATYINENATIDAVLSLAAQLIAAILARRDR
jgi:hypothetical protein